MNYGLIGANGKMGREIKSLFLEAGHRLVLRYDFGMNDVMGDPDVIIDFSLPGALPQTLEFVKQFNCKLITGTTGYSADENELIKELSKTNAVVQSYNYSVGVQMLLKCTEILQEHLTGFDVEISETHHRNKKDKPSGTALMIKDVLQKDVNISSLRLGNITGDHTVSFGGLGEVVSVTHRALSRRTFAEGVLKSAEYILTKEPGYYNFHDVLFNKG